MRRNHRDAYALRAGRQRAGRAARVVGLFSGRGYNIESLTVAETEHQKQLSRITIVTRGTPMVIEQIENQLDRLVPVHRRSRHDRARARDRARTGDGQGARQGRATASRRCGSASLPRPRHRRHHRELRVRDHRRFRQDRSVRRADAPLGLVEVSRTGVAAIAAAPKGWRARVRCDVNCFTSPRR